MGNRKQPFGWKIDYGTVVPEPREASVLLEILKTYSLGASLNELVDWLRNQDVPYEGDKPWNKNMVARILDDKRYAGDEKYPALAPRELLERVWALREAKRVVEPRTEAQKILRRLSGQRATATMERDALYLLNHLIKNPAVIHQPEKQSGGRQADILESELQMTMERQPIQEAHAQDLIFQLAAARYEAIDPAEYETLRMSRLVRASRPMEELDAALLQSLVSSLDTQRGKITALHLKNGQIIKRSELK